GWDQLKMVRERSHPIRNQVVLGEPDVRVTTREGLGDIAVSYSEPAGKVLRRLVIGGSPNSTGRSFRGGAILSRHSRSAVRSPSFAKMGRIARGIDLFRHGATAVKAGQLVSMPALFGSISRQAQGAKPGSLFSDCLLRRLVFGHRLLAFPHLFFLLEHCFRSCALGRLARSQWALLCEVSFRGCVLTPARAFCSTGQQRQISRARGVPPRNGAIWHNADCGTL